MSGYSVLCFAMCGINTAIGLCAPEGFGKALLFGSAVFCALVGLGLTCK